MDELNNFLQQYTSSLKTLNTYKGCINRMLKSIGKNIKNITQDDIINYFSWLIKQHSNTNTVLSYQTILCNFFRQIGRTDLYNCIYHSRKQPNPNMLFRIKPSHEQTIFDTKKLITDEEYNKLLSVINCKRDMIIIKFFRCTGVRVAEEVNIKVEDYHEYYDKEEKKMRYGFEIMGKGRYKRFVFIPEKFSVFFKEYVKENNLKPDDYLVGLSVSGVQKMLKKLCEKAGIRHLICHSFRHTFVTYMVNAGMDSLSLSKITGHSREILEKLYYQATPQIIGRGYKKYFKEES